MIFRSVVGDPDIVADAILTENEKGFLLLGITGSGKTDLAHRILNDLLAQQVYGSDEISLVSLASGTRVERDCDSLRSFLGMYSTSVQSSVSRMWAEAERNTALVTKLRRLKMLIIDDINKLSGAMLTEIDSFLRLARSSSQPFGGVRLGLVGDLHLLPPTSSEAISADAVERDKLIGRLFFFLSPSWASIEDQMHAFYLTEIKKTDDEMLLGLIHALHAGTELSEEVVAALEKRKIRADKNFVTFVEEEWKSTVFICSSRERADAINEINPRSLQLYTYKAKDDVDPLLLEDPEIYTELLFNMSLSEKVEVRRSSRGMILKNQEINNNGELFMVRSGMMGTIEGFANRKRCETMSSSIRLVGKFPESQPLAVQLRLDDGVVVHVGEVTAEVRGDRGSFKRTQLCLLPCVAITSHRAIGYTFDKVFVAIRNRQFVLRGQPCTVFSRVRRLDDMVIEGDLDIRRLSRYCGPHTEVKAFYQRIFKNHVFPWSE